MNELKNILDFYSSLYSISNDLWNIFIVVSAALAGVVFSKEGIKKFHLALLTLIYLGFAFSNQGSLLRVQNLMHSAAVSIQRVEVDNQDINQYTILAKTISASTPKEIRWLHTIITLTVIVLFWSSVLINLLRIKNLARRSRKGAR